MNVTGTATSILGFLLLALPPGVTAQGTGNPHGELPPGLTCSSCHTPEGWSPLREPLDFTHGARSGFTLDGAHRDAPCAGCHLDLRFDAPRIGPLECGACHQDPHRGRLVDACAACHGTRSFQEVDGELAHARTQLPLTGAHLQLPCENCHVQDRLLFTGVDPGCVTCHLEAYRSAAVVDHEGSGFSTDCTACHSDLGWADSPRFDHASASGGYPLVEAHALVRCAGCHQLPGMTPLFQATGPDDCYACHQADYQEEHGGSFSTDCLRCHTQRSWEGALFDHGAEGAFPLLGSHARIDCTACHVVPGYALLFPAPAGNEDCVACHRADYDREHAGDGYPTTCATCHGVEDWDASLEHDARFFPIFSGAHREKWDRCTECHTTPADFSFFSCVDCHQHNRADTDADHREVNDYLYESAGCYACHPSGRS